MRGCTCERGVRRNEVSCMRADACMACGFLCHMSQPREASSYLMVRRPPLEALPSHTQLHSRPPTGLPLQFTYKVD